MKTCASNPSVKKHHQVSLNYHTFASNAGKRKIPYASNVFLTTSGQCDSHVPLSQLNVYTRIDLYSYRGYNSFDFADIRRQLADQLACLDFRAESKLSLLSEFQEFFKRRGEMEYEYARNLERLCEKFEKKTKQRNLRYGFNWLIS